VVDWRRGELERAGWPKTLSPLIALDLQVDLHDACDLVGRGCSATTALDILL
jgi:hypothetical protein